MRKLLLALWLAGAAGCHLPMPHPGASTRESKESNIADVSLPLATEIPAPAPSPEITQVAYVAPPAEPSKPEVLLSDTHEALTLAELERMALAANPSIARAASLVEASRGNWVQVGLSPNPTIGYQGQQIGSRGLAEQDGVFVGQEIVRGGKLQLNRNAASQQVNAQRHRLAAQRLRVTTDVRLSFYQVLVAQEQEAIASQLKQIASESAANANKLFEAKEAARVDIVQSQLELENANILVENAHNRLRTAWRTLAVVVGQPDLRRQPLIGELEEERTQLDWQTSLDALLASSPEIAAANAEVERARWAAERARVERISNVTVQGLVNWRDNGIGGRSDGGVSVGVPLPLWNRNQGAIIQTCQEALAAERALRQLQLSLESRLAPVFERYLNAHHQTDRYRTKILPAAEEALSLTRQRYQAGESDYLNLLTAQRTYSQTRLNYLSAVGELRSAEAEINGLLLSGSLTTSTP